MSDTSKNDTYRAGKRIELEESSDQIVVRALLVHFDAAAGVDVSSEQVSSASTRINVSNENLEALMERTQLAT